MIQNPHGPIDIVLVTWHRPELSELVIKTIQKNTRPGNYRLILIDNGSDRSQQDRVVELADEGYINEFICNDQNEGLEPARNQGLELVRSQPYFICVDNDCLPQPIDSAGFDWIDHLVYLMDNNQLYGALTCRMQVMIGTGNIFEHADENGDDIVEFPHPGGAFRIMVTHAVKRVGGWRNEVKGRGSEETYIGSKLHEIGMKTGYAVKVHTLHLFGNTDTDRWGYDKDWAPEDTGHSDVWHPALANGDDPEEVAKYTGGE
jgi:glycosyltransferase involved in cell wall biosynthesis